MDASYDEIQGWIDLVSAGCDWLWNDRVGGYCARDIRSGGFSNAITNASMLSFYGDVGTSEQRASMAEHCRRILSACQYGMPSWDPEHPDFESRRYWRGPVWAIMNHMITTGLPMPEKRRWRNVSAPTRAGWSKHRAWRNISIRSTGRALVEWTFPGLPQSTLTRAATTWRH